VLGTLWNNARIYLLELGGTLAGPAVVGNLLVLGWLVAVVMGGSLSWRRAPVIALTVAASLAVVMVWPFAQDRFLLPVVPFAGLLAAFAIEEGANRLAFRLRLTAPLGLAILAVVVGLRQVDLRRIAAASFVENRAPASRDVSISYVLVSNSRYIAKLTQWIRANTTPQDRLLVDSPSAIYLYSGRLTMAASPAEAEFAPSVFRYPGRYLTARILQDSITIVAVGGGNGMLRDIGTISRACPGVLRREIPSAEVYRVTGDGTCLRSIAMR
jgi:hypothetical protein